MKKIVLKMVAVALTIMLVLTMVACGSSGESSGAASSGSNKETKGKIAYFNTGLGDLSFNDSGQWGIEELAANGWTTTTIETGDETKGDKWEDMMVDIIEDGYEYIVASSMYTDIMLPLAEEYPDVKFITFDQKMDESEIPENMAVIFYAQNEGSYLVGQVAAAMTESGVVAVNVGRDNPVIEDFVTGYIQGVKDYDPNVKVIKATVGSFNDPAKMKELTLAQVRDINADVFYQVAAGSGAGLIEAAYESGAWAIGVDADQHEVYKNSPNPEFADAIITSMLKRVGESFVSFFGKVEAGDDVWQTVTNLGVKDNAIGYVVNDLFNESVPDDAKARIADAEQKINSGEIKVQSYYDFSNESEYETFLNSVAP